MNLKPSLQPQNITPGFWYYEDKKGLELYTTLEKVGRIRASRLLKSLSRIYGVDFSKYLEKL